MKNLILLLIFISYHALAFNPLESRRFSNDSELNLGSRSVRIQDFDENIKPDNIKNVGTHPGQKIQILRLVKGQVTAVSQLQLSTSVNTKLGIRSGSTVTDSQGVIELSDCQQSETQWTGEFKQSRYSINSRRKVYQISFVVPCKTQSIILFNEDSPAGQVIAIHQVIQRAVTTLAAVSDFKFWNRLIAFQFPSDGDYYINDQVNITIGHHWDVVAHEMGHAIYDQANMGYFGGGQHKIDECYSSEMALSEGWASFFSAWIHVDLKDADAKFEFLVPRRAPIRFENVPQDVCGKSTNEWRVTSFLWDLIDLNNDGEISQAASSRLWNDMLNGHARSIKDVLLNLKQKNWQQDVLLQVWNLNFPAESISLR